MYPYDLQGLMGGEGSAPWTPDTTDYTDVWKVLMNAAGNAGGPAPNRQPTSGELEVYNKIKAGGFNRQTNYDPTLGLMGGENYNAPAPTYEWQSVDQHGWTKAPDGSSYNIWNNYTVPAGTKITASTVGTPPVDRPSSGLGTGIDFIDKTTGKFGKVIGDVGQWTSKNAEWLIPAIGAAAMGGAGYAAYGAPAAGAGAGGAGMFTPAELALGTSGASFTGGVPGITTAAATNAGAASLMGGFTAEELALAGSGASFTGGVGPMTGLIGGAGAAAAASGLSPFAKMMLAQQGIKFASGLAGGDAVGGGGGTGMMAGGGGVDGAGTGSLAQGFGTPTPEYAKKQLPKIDLAGLKKQKTWREIAEEAKQNQKGYYGGYLA